MSSTQDAIEDECNKDVCSWDTRSCETLKSLKDVRQSLDCLVTVFTRVSDDHDRIRSNAAALWLTSMKLSTHARQLHEGLSQTTTSLQGTQTQLPNTPGVLDTTREKLEQMKCDLSHVKTNHEELVMKHIDDKVTDVPVVLQRQVPVPQPFVQTEEQPHPVPQVMTQEVVVPVAWPYTEYVDVPYANPIAQTVEKTVEVPQVQYTDKIVGVLVVTQCRIPTIQTAQRTVEVLKIVSQDRIPQRTVEQLIDTLILQIVEEIEVFKVFIQDRVQQRMVEQTTETPATSLDEETMEHTHSTLYAREDHLPFERGPIRVLTGMARTCLAQASPRRASLNRPTFLFHT